MSKITIKLKFPILMVVSACIRISAQDNAEVSKKDSLFYEMNQVTVTATRYAESIMEVPYAVTIKSKDDFNNIKGYGLDEVLSSVPGVLAQSRNGNQDVRIVIRGFGARGSGDRSNSGTSRGIRILVDGIPETEPDGRTSFDLIDLTLVQNIEVLRSNVSAVWGNASGGIINISRFLNSLTTSLRQIFLQEVLAFKNWWLKQELIWKTEKYLVRHLKVTLMDGVNIL